VSGLVEQVLQYEQFATLCQFVRAASEFTNKLALVFAGLLANRLQVCQVSAIQCQRSVAQLHKCGSMRRIDRACRHTVALYTWPFGNAIGGLCSSIIFAVIGHTRTDYDTR
jgi:hypothetical protein